MTTLIPSMLALLLAPTAMAADAPAPGNLVITEVMTNPRYVTPGNGEWFEVTNVSGKTINLAGLEVSSSGAQGFTVTENFFLGAGGSAVIASDTNTAGLPRVDVSYDVALLPLGNGNDDLTISVEGTEIDSVTFSGTWGKSTQLNPASLSATANDTADAWCAPVSSYGSGNLGTPGRSNDSCPAVLADLLPGDLIVSELMIDPMTTQRGEWIEVQNLSDYRIDLQGLEIATTTDLVVIDTSVVVEPGEVAVLANYATANGGISRVDWAANGRLGLDNAADEVLLSYSGTEFHRFAYDADVDPIFTGVSLRVDSTMAANGDYDDASAWCIETEEYRANSTGTPGAVNGDCGIDVDGDGVPFEADCDDSNADTHRWADEICDGEDNDCNGTVDDGAMDVSTFWTDADGDGYGDPSSSVLACTVPDGAAERAGDCDDSDAATHPFADETCDGIDNDCDLSVDESAIDATTYYVDADNDGFGTTATALTACEAPEGYATEPGDCDDTRFAVRPGADEVCDLLDNDCDGATDEDAVDGETFYADLDRDGFGSSSDSLTACSQPTGYVRDAGDCDDSTAQAHPGAHETCDTVDNDCDGEIDEDVLTTWYADLDGDTYGDPANTELACSAPAGFVAVARDCDDSDAAVSPAATETCDRIDNDCNGVVDECGGNKFYRDADGDGFGDPTTEVDGCFAPEGYVTDSNDCDDTDPNLFPGNAEVCDDVDNDCDGDIDEGLDQTWYADSDADGYGDSRVKLVACAQPDGYTLDATDCDDSEPTAFPGNPEVCDEIDNNCSGAIDEGVTTTFWRDRDADGYGEWGSDKEACSLPDGYADNHNDCDDRDETAFPGNPEVCDQADNDCDGTTDEGLETTYHRDLDRDGYGHPTITMDACEQPAGYVENGEDCNDWHDESFPGAEETCDGQDNDCDGATDEEGVATFYFDADGDGYGTNEVTVETCPAPEGYVRAGGDCDDADPTRSPGVKEVCDGIDNNCRGGVDENLTREWFADADGDGFGDPDAPMDFCSDEKDPAGYVKNDDDCNDADASIKPWAQETCDGVDQDCDGEIDDNTGVVGYLDRDGDGWGDPATAIESCNMEAGYIPQGGDCDDTDDEVHPLGVEVCDGVDQDCNGEIDDGLDETFYADRDGDGVGVETETIEACELPAGYAETAGDCDDTEPLRTPGREEVCDGIDNNCNDAVDEGATTDFYVDADGDGYGDDDNIVKACELEAGLSEDGGDCDDADASAFPGNVETCDEVDNDCNDQIDDGVQTIYFADNDGDGLGNINDTLAACEQPEGYVLDSSDCDDADGTSGNLVVFYIDVDGDGHGHPSDTVEACTVPAGYSEFSDDCDDLDPTNFPSNEETCDGMDNDCDGAVDEGATKLFFADVDADGYGDALDVVESCSAPAGYVEDDTDCDDTQPSINPGMEEVCDELDNNCDDQIDEGVSTAFWADKDVDGYGDPDVMVLACDAHVCETECFFVQNDDDCDDDRPDVHPAMDEVCDGVDNDCDTEIDEDLRGTFYADNDGDGYGDIDSPVESCGPDAVAVTDSTDCDDADAAINPGATEACDELDNDCDGQVDEDAACETEDPEEEDPEQPELTFYADADGDGYGDASVTIEAVEAPEGYVDNAEDCDDSDAAVHPFAGELCNLVDDDCDGEIDEDLGEAFYADVDGDGYGDPAAGIIACEAPEGFVADDTDCDDLLSSVNPGMEEVCDDLDNDCDDDADEGLDETWYLDADADGFGDESQFLLACAAEGDFATKDTTDCDDSDATIHPLATETCDELDNDCDALVDEDVQDVFFADADGDGYGDPADTTKACEAPEGFVSDDTDCNDDVAEINPAAEEVCDDLDNDCDGTIDTEECEVETAKALWVRTDGLYHSSPDREERHGSSEAAALLEAQGLTWDSVRMKDVEFNSELLENYEVVILFGKGTDGPLTDEEAADLEAFVADGGGLLYHTFHPSTQSCAMLDSLPESFGIGCVEGNRVLRGTGTPTMEHALTQGVNTVAINGGEQWEVFGAAQVVVEHKQGYPMVVATELGEGRVVGIADEWPLYNSGTSKRFDISAYNNEQLVENTFCWLASDACDIDPTWYLDADGDGYGDASEAIQAAEAPEGYVAEGTDCDDGDALSHPGAEELCDELDNDCDGTADEDVVCTVEENLSFCSAADGTSRVLVNPDTPADETKLSKLGPAAVAVSYIHPAWTAQVDGATWIWETPLPTDPTRSQEATLAMPFTLPEEMELVEATLNIAADNRYYASINGEQVTDSRIGATFRQAESWDVTDAIRSGTNRLDVRVVNWAGSADPKSNPAGALYCIDMTVQCAGDCPEPELQTWYLDADGDGYGDASATVNAAAAPSGYVADDSDCDDAEATVHPAGTESCDELDNDCDGLVDEGLSQTWYLDADGDGFGTLARSVEACAAYGDFTAVDPRDCDDDDATVHPAAEELCDGIDNDCDREIDEDLGETFYADLDGDGYGSSETIVACTQPSGTSLKSGDCDDDAADVHPGAEDVCDYIDNDCDGVRDEDPEYTYNADHDGDGYGDPVEVIAACAPPAGYIADDTDCDDNDRDTHPHAVELCDGIDNDCDGAIETLEECPVETTYTVCSAEDGWNRELVNPSAPVFATALEELGPWAVEADESKSWKASIPGATWIWINDDIDGPHQAQDAAFARPFELSPEVEVLSATLEIAADRYYTATLNGTEVGSDDTGRSRLLAMSFDVTDAVRTGWNRLDVEVEGNGGSNSNASAAGLLYCLTIEVECEGQECPELDDASMVTDEPESEVVETRNGNGNGNAHNSKQNGKR